MAPIARLGDDRLDHARAAAARRIAGAGPIWAAGRSGRRAAWPRSGFGASARGACSPAWRRIRSCRWSAAERRRRADAGCAGARLGWPIPRGGAQPITDALASYLRALGGEIRTGERVATLAQLPPARVVLLDVTPRQLLAIAGERLPAGYRRAAWALPLWPGRVQARLGAGWADPLDCARVPARAATVHLGGTLAEIAASERAVWQGGHAERPFVLLAQHSLFDPSRAPAGKHTAWAYCHVPNGSDVDMTARIEAQIERFAPGFRDRILARNTLEPAAMQAHNANYIGGDINGGVQDLRQLFTRPVASLDPYETPARLYLCSSSTPPGGGVHGLCGYFAAQSALRDDP